MLIFRSTNKKIVSFVVLLSLIAAAFFTTNQKADACLSQVLGGAMSTAASIFSVPTSNAVTDTATATATAKDCIEDFLHNNLKKTFIRSLVKDIVNWINTGFEGSPSWGYSLTQAFEDYTHSEIDMFMKSNVYSKGLCNGFEIPLKFAIQLNFYKKSAFGDGRYIPQCTLETAQESIENLEQFYENNPIEDSFSWDEYLQRTTNFDNNAFGVYFNMSYDLERLIEKNADKTDRELLSNNGFRSLRQCDEAAYKNAELNEVRGEGWGEDKFYETEEEYNEALQDIERLAAEGYYGKYNGSNKSEKYCPVTTPGTQVSAMLNKSLGADIDEIITADEFDEILGALIGQLTNKLITDGVRSITGDYDKYADVNLEETKEDYIQKFQLAAYDVEREILESSLRTVETAEANLEATQACWQNREAGIKEHKDGRSTGHYLKINMGNKAEIYGYLGSENETFSNTKDLINSKINQVELNRANASNAIREILDSAGYEQFMSAKEAADNVIPPKIEQEIKRRDFTDLIFDEIVNGTRTNSFDGDGREYRAGGFNEILRYCETFTIQNPPETYSDEPNDIHNEETVITFDSLKGINDRHIHTINIIDGYDPVPDIFDLEGTNDVEASLDENYVSSGDRGNSCISNDGISVPDGERAGKLHFRNTEGNCRWVTNANCEDGIFSHTYLPSGDEYPSYFWLDNEEEHECGVSSDPESEYYRSCFYAGTQIKNEEIGVVWYRYRNDIEDENICIEKRLYCNAGEVEGADNSGEVLDPTRMYNEENECLG